MTAIAFLLRLTGRLLLAVSYELEAVVADRRGVPDYVPLWMDEEVDL